MKLKQLVLIKNSMQKTIDEYGNKFSNGTKVDFDGTINFLANIIGDVESEMKKAKHPYVIYHLKIDLIKGR